MSRNRRRNPSPYSNRSSRLFPLYAAETSRGWRVTRNVGLADAEQKVAIGRFVRVYDLNQVCVGYQMVDALPDKAIIVSPVTNPSITANEMQANAGQVFKHGKSRTATMPEDLKLQRVHPVSGKRLAPEDYVERASAKVRDWNAVGDDRAASVGQFQRSQEKR